METLIETKNLTKIYGTKTVLNNVNLNVPKGAIYGLIGRNGAGKTTLMKIVLNLANKTSGEIKLFGGENLNKAREKIGALVEMPALYKQQTAKENMKSFAILSPTTDEKIDELLKLVGLENTGNKKAGMFSLGMKQRLGIAIALLGNPEILILDEPLNGLDPTGIKEIRNVILKLNKSGVTFLISSHLLDELGKIATSYGVLRDGVLEEFDLDDVKEKCKSCVKICVDDADKGLKILKLAFPDLEAKKDKKTLVVEPKKVDTSLLNELLITGGVKVFELKVERADLEDFFVEKLGK